MLWSAVLLVLTAVLAVVALTAAVVAVRAVREMRRSAAPSEPLPPSHPRLPETESREPAEPDRPVALVRVPELEPRLVEGRILVPPTQDQVLAAVLGRPGVRANVLLFGLAHALRAENRDRIVALIRREYRQRRRERLRAGRQAARVTPIRKAS